MARNSLLQAEELRNKFKAADQAHVFQFEGKLSDEDKAVLYADLSNIDLPELASVKSRIAKATSSSSIKPFPHVTPFEGTASDRKRWEDIGIQKLGEGKCAVLLLAGGQGTRLGTTDPKGMYDIGLPSGKSLFQMQAERLFRLQQVVKKRTGKDVTIPWYIMTSEATTAGTKRYFEENRYFGLQSSQLFFFEQEMLPCITPEGKILMESMTKVARAPNGNGGLYSALSRSGALQDMSNKGIEYVYQYCVDNALIKMADPIFFGFCFEKNADVAAKVIPKAYPEEAVGVLCLREDGKPGVIEYSEIDKSMAVAKDPETGKLIYNAAHICMNMYSVSFLKEIAASNSLPFHIAKKKIPSVNEQGKTVTPKDINGWKLEMFIFDIFEFAKNMVALEVLREEEFSPLKNAPGSPQDSPDSCRKHLSDMFKNMIKQAGGHIEEANGDETALCEVSPLISCSAEDLDQLVPLVRGKTFALPVELNLETSSS